MSVFEIGHRIKQAIGLTGNSVTTFCDETGRSRSSLGLLISGRGGIPKKDFFTTLSKDLKLFGVYVDAEWIAEAKGKSPSLITKDTYHHPKKKQASKFYPVVNNYISCLTDDIFFDVNLKKYYIICQKLDKKLVKSVSEYAQLYISFSEKNTSDIFLFKQLCNLTNSLIVIKSSRLICIPINDINQLAIIKLMIHK